MSGFSLYDLMRADSGGTPNGQSARTSKPRPLSPLAEQLASMPLPKPFSASVLAGAVRLADFTLIVVLGLAIYGFYVARAEGFSLAYPVATVSLATLTVLFLEGTHTYQTTALRSLFRQGVRILSCWSLAILCATALMFFLKIGDVYSRIWLGIWYLTGFVALFAERFFVSKIVGSLARSGRLDRRTAIVGGGEPAERLIRAIEADPESDVKICGVFDDRGDDRSPEMVAAYPKLGTVDDLVEFARRTRLDLVIFTVPVSAEARLLQMLRKLWILPVDIRLSAHTSKLRFRPRSYSYIGGVPVFDVVDKPIADWDVVMKWLFDKIVGTLALIILAPVFLVTAIAIKLDSAGPVFFKQRRYGFNNELIEIYKFRSMYTDMADATASKLATKDDPRVTRVGRFIRKSSIDELPQLINVIFKGNLSLVGPRPHAVHAKAADRLYDDVVDGYFARHKVKPGITGWAQINGWRGETDTQEKIQKRVEHDLYYIENWSILFDMTILALTPPSLLKTENAY